MPPANDSPLLRFASRLAFLSALVGVLGIAFLIIFFSIGGIWGPLNDGMVVLQYLLMIPIAVALLRLLEDRDPGRARTAFRVGIVGMAMVVLIQMLLLLDILPFGAYFPAVTIAFLVALAWFALNRSIEHPVLPRSMLLTVLAGLYVAYPIWAWEVGRRLREESTR